MARAVPVRTAGGLVFVWGTGNEHLPAPVCHLHVFFLFSRVFSFWTGASERLDPELAYALTRTLLEGRRAFASKEGNMELGMLERENVRMLRMPLHPGAERYYKEHTR
jgi:hypothetical protein